MEAKTFGQLVPLGGGDPIPLIRETLVVGRRESCDICLRFPNVSGRHCELQLRDGLWYVRDLDSTNGTCVNDVPIHNWRILQPGDEIAIATRRFTIHYTPPPGTVLRVAAEDDLDEIFSQSLLERAGLSRPERERRRSG
ncbi:MAG: FHA domain-containing protein [Gemmataceae bacterium]|nr:FHA domain-containing protein [Gemmataceae bacterium]